MISKLKLIVVALLFAIIVMEPALARSIRCGTHVISTGQNAPGMYEVLKRCGEPKVRYGNTWIYEKSSSVSYRLTFKGNGQLSRIE